VIHIRYANRLESLAGMLVERIATDPVGVLEPEVVVVQGPATARWLTLWFAEHMGICANVRFPLPGGFIWDVFRTSLPELPEENGHQPAVMAWRIMSTLDELQHRAEFAPVRNWLTGGDETRRYELAVRLAETFDQYLVYRPDWIRAWEAGRALEGLEAPHAGWQGRLWRSLASATGSPHWVEAWERFIDSVPAPARLPRRISLFGLPTLSPGYLDVLARLPADCRVELYVVNPCREYWSEIVSKRTLARRAGSGDPEASCFETGNGLLASLGGQGAEYIDALQDLPAVEVADYRDPGTGNLLSALQSDILNLRNRGSDDWPALTLVEDDRSLQVHVCHGPMREVEVLHDRLLAMFDEDAGLAPADVAVLVPDIAAYAPFVETVFGGAEPERRIPFGLGSTQTRGDHALVAAFDVLLDVSMGRFGADSVMGLLDGPALRRRFGLEDADLERVHELVREAAIRWGVDAGFRAAEGLPELPDNTWRAGLDRLVLGHAMGGEGETPFAGILPAAAVEGAGGLTAGRLCRFAEALFELRPRLAQDRPVSAWLGVFRQLLDEFFAPDDAEEAGLRALREALDAVGAQAQGAGYGAPLPLAVMRAAIRRQLDGPAGIAGAFSGGVSFGGLAVMRGIPRRVVCVLGMNDGAFPLVRRGFDFDLMKDDHRRGDRSRRDDDRYLFLETLLSARDRLYLSYTGRSVRDDSVLPPSSLVSELMESVDRGFVTTSGEAPADAIATVHPLQPFSTKYFAAGTGDFSYNRSLAEAARAALQPVAPRPFLDVDLPEQEEGIDRRRIPLADLEAFLVNPVRFVVRRRLGILLDEKDATVENAERFRLDWFDQDAVRRELVSHLLRGTPPEETFSLCRSRGLLPHGSVGRVEFDSQVSLVKAILPRIEPWRDEIDGYADISLEIGKHEVFGRITGVGPGGHTDWQPVTTGARHYLRLWLRHLSINAARPAGAGRESRFVGEDGTLTARPVEDALPQLSSLLGIFEAGMRKPLRFFPNSALAFASAGEKRDPLDAARRVWDGNPPYSRPESDNPYYRLVFAGTDPLDAQFAELARDIFGPILDHTERVP
jgi:exodeoxyribonuclease V gamma subunit